MAKTSLYVEFQGEQVEDKTVYSAIKKSWAESGKKVGDIKTLEIYIKPEDGTAYYVINETESGKVTLF